MNLSTSSDNTSQQVSLKLYSLSIYTLMYGLFEHILVQRVHFSTYKSKVTMNLSKTSSDSLLQQVRLFPMNKSLKYNNNN